MIYPTYEAQKIIELEIYRVRGRDFGGYSGEIPVNLF